MLEYLGKRLIQLIPILLLMSVIVFVVLYLLPGDPATLALIGHGATTLAHVEELREQMGLNDPIYVQYGRYLGNALRGNLGTSARFRRPVVQVILEQFPSTLQLAIVGMSIALMTGLSIGIIAAIWRYSWLDTLGMLLALVGVSTPIFWSGLMAIFLFSFRLGWLPSTGTGGWKGMVLPAFTLGFVATGTIARLTRSCLIEVLSQDYIRTARAKGLKEWGVISRHAMKNAMIPVVTVLGLQFGGMLGGAVITETVFSRPGLGRLMVSAILWEDYPLAQGAILLTALSFVLVNLAVDVSYAFLDPRIRYK
ncbi:MAG: ABC transporter permease [Chloroflexi bacterium]|nr:ABC transporter permease [Chloroflexota bacterium]